MMDGLGVNGLAALEAQVRDEIARTQHPNMAWLKPSIAPDSSEALDVLIVGAGQSGLAIAFGLMRSQVSRVLLVDKAERGREGPWRTYARMHTLRSPKSYTGPDLDLPALTYQSWHEARFGKDDWDKLGLIPTGHWADYLDWFRDVLGINVRSKTEVVDIASAGDLLAATVRSEAGDKTLYARKIVLATGQESLGDWITAPLVGDLPQKYRAHCAEPIDFAALRGKRVAVIGAGASAFDNAAAALEAGAGEVHLLCRRAQPQVVQPYRWLTFRGFLRHLSDLDDAWRWRFMRKILDLREGFPQPTFDRCAIHEHFHLHVGAPITAARESGSSVILTTPEGEIAADFVISAIGIDIDPAQRPELNRFAHNIASWADRYTPPAHERDDRLGRFPYLGDDFALAPKNETETPWIKNIHLFSIAATMSFGPSGSSINAMTTAVPKLVSGVTRSLFSADLDRHWAELEAYDVPQAVIRPPPKP